jgi:hypothetical protein
MLRSPVTTGRTGGCHHPAPTTIFGLLVFGIVTFIVTDLLLRPGLSAAGRVLLNIITFGSSAVRDATYATAALDPTPLPALSGLSLLSGGLCGTVVSVTLAAVGFGPFVGSAARRRGAGETGAPTPESTNAGSLEWASYFCGLRRWALRASSLRAPSPLHLAYLSRKPYDH